MQSAWRHLFGGDAMPAGRLEKDFALMADYTIDTSHLHVRRHRDQFDLKRSAGTVPQLSITAQISGPSHIADPYMIEECFWRR
jgi:hypothetical protein